MAAPKENQFWKIRTSHGRKALFDDPALLEKSFQEYINWVDGHPWFKVEQLKKPYQDVDGKWVTVTKIPTARPYTIYGFCIYLGVNSVWFNQFEKSINEKIADQGENVDQKLKDFSQVLTHVRDVIYQQKYEGAAVGAFNASIIARDLSLKDNTTTELKNPEGESFRTDNVTRHEVIFTSMSPKKSDDSTGQDNSADVQ